MTCCPSYWAVSTFSAPALDNKGKAWVCSALCSNSATLSSFLLNSSIVACVGFLTPSSPSLLSWEALSLPYNCEHTGRLAIVHLWNLWSRRTGFQWWTISGPLRSILWRWPGTLRLSSCTGHRSDRAQRGRSPACFLRFGQHESHSHPHPTKFRLRSKVNCLLTRLGPKTAPWTRSSGYHTLLWSNRCWVETFRGG